MCLRGGEQARLEDKPGSTSETLYCCLDPSASRGHQELWDSVTFSARPMKDLGLNVYGLQQVDTGNHGNDREPMA